MGTGEGDGVRALIAFYPPEASNSNGMYRDCTGTFPWSIVWWFLDVLLLLASVSIVITGLGADYTRLESFGKVDAFAETLVGFIPF